MVYFVVLTTTPFSAMVIYKMWTDYWVCFGGKLRVAVFESWFIVNISGT